ncbi:hypothetical protein Hanom_Chr02g00116941 [Helianthus anomalus]
MTGFGFVYLLRYPLHGFSIRALSHPSLVWTGLLIFFSRTTYLLNIHTCDRAPTHIYLMLPHFISYIGSQLNR